MIPTLKPYIILWRMRLADWMHWAADHVDGGPTRASTPDDIGVKLDTKTMTVSQDTLDVQRLRGEYRQTFRFAPGTETQTAAACLLFAAAYWQSAQKMSPGGVLVDTDVDYMVEVTWNARLVSCPQGPPIPVWSKRIFDRITESAKVGA